jgi:transposase-like protein
MNIIERGRAFAQSLRQLMQRTAQAWRRCPNCGSTVTHKNGSYTRRPWGIGGRQVMRVQRHLCEGCGRSYSEQSALLVPGSWYAREVHRMAVDHWQHMGSSLRRTAEMLRSWLGRQERWLMWRPFDKEPPREGRCKLSASTIHRWLDQAGRVAQQTVEGQLEGIGAPEEVGTDGLWVKLRGGAKRVVLLVVDSVTGLVWPPVVVLGEECEEAWKALFERAKEAGMELDRLRGVTSDGAQGLLAYISRGLYWVQHQRCIWHLWRTLGRLIRRAASQATEGVAEPLVKEVRQQVRDELKALVRGVIDASSYEVAEGALASLQAHALGAPLAQVLIEQWDRLLVYQLDYYRGLQRVSPEWYWRDFRMRLSRGRNHGSDQRFERAALVWAIYRNFTPAQWRSERKRRYRYPGQSPLQVAGAPPGNISYLDALGV